jgi:hypothetical protein
MISLLFFTSPSKIFFDEQFDFQEIFEIPYRIDTVFLFRFGYWILIIGYFLKAYRNIQCPGLVWKLASIHLNRFKNKKRTGYCIEQYNSFRHDFYELDCLKDVGLN